MAQHACQPFGGPSILARSFTQGSKDNLTGTMGKVLVLHRPTIRNDRPLKAMLENNDRSHGGIKLKKTTTGQSDHLCPRARMSPETTYFMTAAAVAALL